MSISMTARKAFTNPRITGPHPHGAVSPGDPFTTDWVHAKELHANGLADADDPDALEREPVEAMQPHNQISAPDLARVNARRSRARGDADRRSPDQKAAETKADIDRQAAALKAETDRRAEAERKAEAERTAEAERERLASAASGRSTGIGTDAPAAVTGEGLTHASGTAVRTNAPALPGAPGTGAV